MLQRIGKYEVLETVARDGQGTVYRAREEGSEADSADHVLIGGQDNRIRMYASGN